jgi:DNA primase
MNAEKVRELMGLLCTEVPLAQTRAGWIVCQCPLRHWRHDGGTDKNPSFAVRREGGDAHTSCFSCGWHGSLSDLTAEMRYRNKVQAAISVKWPAVDALIEKVEDEGGLNFDVPDIDDMLFGPKAGLHEFPQWWLNSFPAWREVPFARAYLQERGVSGAVADALGIVADTQQQRVCFPVRGFSGKLLGLHGRAIKNGADPKYRMYLQAGRNNQIVWLGESWVDQSKPIVVVEGPLDLASVYRVYRNAVSPLFATPGWDKIWRMAGALEQVIFLDRGKGGDAGREKFKHVLRKDHILHFAMPPDGRKDPGECTTAELREVLAPFVAFDSEL